VAAVQSGLSLTPLRISQYRVSFSKFTAVHLKILVVMESEGDENPVVAPVK
jgi:hypothetical protein